MSEENNKPKATLIKHVVNPVEHNKEQKSPVTEPESKPKAPEKRRVVVVKKKVVVVKPQARKDATKPENEKQEDKTSKDEGTKEVIEKKKTSSGGHKSSVVRKAHRHTASDTLSASPLHNGPVVIRPTNLPPVPNQGLTVKDHKELQDKNTGGTSSKESPVPSTGPRVAGMVGGRPAPGTRPQYRSNNNRSGYQGQDTRGPARPAGTGYQGQANRGPARPGGYQGQDTRGPARPGGYKRWISGARQSWTCQTRWIQTKSQRSPRWSSIPTVVVDSEDLEVPGLRFVGLKVETNLPCRIWLP